MRIEFSAVTTASGIEVYRAESELLAADFAARVNQNGGYKMSNAHSPEFVAVRPVRVPGRKPRNRGRFAKFATVAALALALASGFGPSSPANAEWAGVRNFGTANAAIEVRPGKFVQLEYVKVYGLEQTGLIECEWFEDYSAHCGPGR